MKIIGIDNYNRESVADVLIADDVNPLTANIVLDELNREAGDGPHSYFYKLVDDDYRLWRGMEDLV